MSVGQSPISRGLVSRVVCTPIESVASHITSPGKSVVPQSCQKTKFTNQMAIFEGILYVTGAVWYQNSYLSHTRLTRETVDPSPRKLCSIQSFLPSSPEVPWSKARCSITTCVCLLHGEGGQLQASRKTS